MKIFVPIVTEGNEGSLYRFRLSDSQKWMSIDVGNASLGKKTQEIKKHFKPMTVALVDMEGRPLGRIQENMTSVFLGMFLAMQQHMGTLRCKANSAEIDAAEERPIPIASLTIAGDITFKEGSPLPLLKSVEDVEKLFYIFRHDIQHESKNDIHQFIYIAENENLLPIKEGLHQGIGGEKNITVKAFSVQRAIVNIAHYLSFGRDPYIGSKEYDQFKGYGDLFSVYAENPDPNREYHLNLAADYYRKAFVISKNIRIRNYLDLAKNYLRYTSYLKIEEYRTKALEHCSSAMALIESEKDYLAEYKEDYAAYRNEALKYQNEDACKSIMEADANTVEAAAESAVKDFYLFVPVLSSAENKSSLYQVVENAPVQMKSFMDLIEPIEKYLGNTISIGLVNPQGEYLEEIRAEMSSALLGIFLGIKMYMGNLHCKASMPVGSVTVTGEVYFKRNLQIHPLLKAVTGISKKFETWKKALNECEDIFAKDATHIFIYVSDKEESLSLDGLNNTNIIVRAFSSNDGIVDIETYLATGKAPQPCIGFKDYDQYKGYGDISSIYAEEYDKKYLEIANDYYDKAFAVSKKIRIRSLIDIGNHFSKFAAYSEPRNNTKRALEHYMEAKGLIGKEENYPEEYVADYNAYNAEIISNSSIAMTELSVLEGNWDSVETLVKELAHDNFTQGIADTYRIMIDFKNRMDEYFQESESAYRKLLDQYHSRLENCLQQKEGTFDLQEKYQDMIREIKIHLAIVLVRRSDLNAKKKEAILKEALDILNDRKSFPDVLQEDKRLQYAERDRVLGLLYFRLSLNVDRRDNIQKSIDAYFREFNVYTEDTYPIKFGLACYELSNTYMSAYSATSDIEYAKKARDCCLNALRIFNKENFAVYYAQAKIYLGNASAALLDKLKEDFYFSETEEAYQSALAIFTKESYPYWHGKMLHLIGEMYRKYAGAISTKEHQIENLNKALQYFEKALEIRTAKKDYIRYHCVTQLQRGRAYNDLAKIEQSEAYYNNAVTVFDETILICLDNEPLVKGRLYNNRSLAFEGLFNITKDPAFIEKAIEGLDKGLEYAGKDEDECTRMKNDLIRIKTETRIHKPAK
jgi:tetratricopeptide (TPR) repeat protein